MVVERPPYPVGTRESCVTKEAEPLVASASQFGESKSKELLLPLRRY